MTDPIRITLHFHKFKDDAITIEFCPGLHVIIGEAGVGKSTFIQQLTGQKQGASNFSLTVQDGMPQYRIIPQNPDNQIINPTVGEELAFTPECLSTPHEDIQKQIRTLTDQWDFLSHLERHPDTLSGGEKEILNLLTASAEAPDLLIIDDGLSFLAKKTKQRVWHEIFNPLIAKGKTILWFTPDDDDLKFGLYHWQLTLSDFCTLTTPNSEKYPVRNSKTGYLAINFENLSLRLGGKRILNQVTCQAEAVRCLGLSGDNGSGKTTLAKILLGLIDPDDGKVNLTVKGKKPRLGYLDQFPERLLGVAGLEQFVHQLQVHGFISRKGVETFIRELNKHHISWDAISNLPTDKLSWTLIRFVLILLFIQCNFDLLILDEPTFGLGHRDKVILHDILTEYLHAKHAILISHDNDFLQALCDAMYSFDHDTIIPRNETIKIRG